MDTSHLLLGGPSDLGTVDVDLLHSSFRGVISWAGAVNDHVWLDVAGQTANNSLVGKIRDVILDATDGLGVGRRQTEWSRN